MRSIIIRLFAVTSLTALLSIAAFAQTSVFTYQGKLNDGSAAANGTYDLQFDLYDSLNGGAQVGSTQTLTGVAVANGVFTVQLDFGATAFPGAARFLEISVKKPADAAYTPLTPRQSITSTPYAMRALNATNIETTAGNSVVNAINDATTNVTINESRLPANLVRVAPDARQDSTSTGNGNGAVLNLSGTYNKNVQSFFRWNYDGGFLTAGNYDGDGSGEGVPAEGSGTRMMWYPRKAAFRAGYISGTQWDAANIGNYSNSFGRNARSSGDFGFTAGRDVTAANLASVALGDANTASGAYSVALGRGAHTNARQGSFVFADNSTNASFVYDSNGNLDFTASDLNGAFLRAGVNHSANWRVSGGFRIFTSSNLSTGVTFQSGASVSNWGQANAVISTSTGAMLTTGGVWQNASSRALKDNFATVDSRAILKKVLSLPIQTWNYKAEGAAIRHIGPISQDFKSTFDIGLSDESIGTVDADGVALAAIQGLSEELKDRDRKIEKLEEQLKQQQAAIESLKKIVCAANPTAEGCQ